MRYNLTDTRAILDALRAHGISTDVIAQRLQLHQVHANERTVRSWYSGRTNIRNVEYRALRDLLRDVSANYRGYDYGED